MVNTARRTAGAILLLLLRSHSSAQEPAKENSLPVAVWKRILFSNNVPTVINDLRHPSVSLGSGLSVNMPDGTSRSLSQEEGIAMVLDEFYNMVQVEIGEAISVVEPRAFLAEKKTEFD